MQVLKNWPSVREARRGFSGVMQDTVAGANGMTGKNALQDDSWPYFWREPGPNTQYVQRVASIPTPAAATQTEVLTLLVPAGFKFILNAIRQNFYTSNAPSPFVEGSGDILWTIDVDNPIGSTAISSFGLPDFTNMADERGSKLGPWPIDGYTVFDEYQTLRCKVTTTAAIPVGAPNFIVCGLFGWWDRFL